MNMDMDTAIDIDGYGEKKSYGVVPSYRNQAIVQTDINMNPALDLPRSAVSRGAASRTSSPPSFDHSSQPILSRQPSIRTFPTYHTFNPTYAELRDHQQTIDTCQQTLLPTTFEAPSITCTCDKHSLVRGQKKRAANPQSRLARHAFFFASSCMSVREVPE
jgi:hypothetical protein